MKGYISHSLEFIYVDIGSNQPQNKIVIEKNNHGLACMLDEVQRLVPLHSHALTWMRCSALYLDIGDVLELHVLFTR